MSWGATCDMSWDMTCDMPWGVTHMWLTGVRFPQAQVCPQGGESHVTCPGLVNSVFHLVSLQVIHLNTVKYQVERVKFILHFMMYSRGMLSASNELLPHSIAPCELRAFCTE